MLGRKLRCLILRTKKQKDRHLFDLCINSKYNNLYENDTAWENVRHWFTNDLARVKQTAAYQDKVNLMTPLHLILSGEGRGRYPPIDIVEIFINYAPETVKMRDAKGRLPIHIAYQYGHLLDVVKTLLEAYPKSVLVTDNEGWLPIHYACWWPGSFEALNPLLQADQESTDYFCSGDELKKLSKILRKSWEKHHINKFEHLFYLHKACAGEFSVHHVKLFLEASPESCIIKDANGMTPLHHACSNPDKSSKKIIMLLLNASPESTLVADNPSLSTSIKRAAAHKDERGMLLLHHFAGCNKFFREDLLVCLFRSYPEAIAVPDNHGLLPFHHACLSAASTVETLMLFLKLHPTCLVVE